MTEPDAERLKIAASLLTLYRAVMYRVDAEQPGSA